jgi:DNA-binding transcriptional MerR regulator
MFGISRDSLRHYERCGLVPAPLRSAGGYRLYTAPTVERIRLVRGALAIGFTVQELKRILRQRDAGGAPCGEVLQLASAKLRDLDLRIRQLVKLRQQLRRTVDDWRQRMNTSGAQHRAGLLESFVTSFPESARATSPQISPGLARKFNKHENEETNHDDNDRNSRAGRRTGR